MIYITQLIYVHPGQEGDFHQFEALAIPLIAKYNGRLLMRLRPSDESFIEGSLEKPYEAHFVEFGTLEDFEHFKNDAERLKFLHLKEQSVKASLLVQGIKL